MRKNKGITLIALVITIIVMLILVAVTISIAVNGGLFSYAGKAAKDTEKAKKEETSLASLRANMTTAELIEQFKPEKEWSVAWVYDGSDWSNPYFKDKTLENNFSFSDDSGTYSWYMDTSYSLNSEEDISGELVVKLYTDGELVISGSGPLVVFGEPNSVDKTCPWKGGFHECYTYNNNQTYYEYITDTDFLIYLRDHISTVVFSEGITSIPRWAFHSFQATNYVFPSTITSIDSRAFEESSWIYALDTTTPGYDDWNDWLRYVDVDINGTIWKLCVYQFD